jgi:hypothetical protein
MPRNTVHLDNIGSQTFTALIKKSEYVNPDLRVKLYFFRVLPPDRSFIDNFSCEKKGRYVTKDAMGGIIK